MPDQRFYEALGPAPLAELAALAGAVLADPALGERQVDGVSPLDAAGPTHLAYLGDKRYAAALANTRAGACFVRASDAGRAPKDCALLITADPQTAYARVAPRLVRPRRHPAGGPAVHPEADLEPGVVVGQGAVVGPGARIGADTVIAPNAVIGPGVAIGRRCRIGAGAVVGFSLIGDEVTILAGAVVGEPGFGVTGLGGQTRDVPQLGRVILQDRVSVGANSCIDRGAWDDTVVGENTKIDNLCQIAHNARIGRNCVLAAYTGISGSVTVGDGAMFGGRAGVADHLKIGEGARIGAAAAVMRDVPAGETWTGGPARPLRNWLRETAWLARAAQTGAQGRGGLRGAEGDD
jgi:UDP-3-O-[3-hydroxymyristoyl] glucosamine N-acyltransferase